MIDMTIAIIRRAIVYVMIKHNDNWYGNDNSSKTNDNRKKNNNDITTNITLNNHNVDNDNYDDNDVNINDDTINAVILADDMKMEKKKSNTKR